MNVWVVKLMSGKYVVTTVLWNDAAAARFACLLGSLLTLLDTLSNRYQSLG